MPQILLVDDCQADTLLAVQALSGRGDWYVATAADGEVALQMLAAAPFDVVISDIRMPRIDGLSLLGRMRDEHPDVPVVITTSHGSEAIAMKAIQGGAASYVPKTDLQTDLVEVVETVLAHSLKKQNEHRLFECIASQQLEIRLTDNDRRFVPSVVQYLQQLSLSIGLTSATDNVQLGVALEETLINAVVHGNLEVSSQLKQRDDNAYSETIEVRRAAEPYRDRVVHISVSLTPAEGRFTIRDEGPGFDVSSLPDPTDPENLLKPSGRGIMLINAFMDDVCYNEVGNEVCLVKRRESAVTPAATEPAATEPAASEPAASESAATAPTATAAAEECQPVVV